MPKRETEWPEPNIKIEFKCSDMLHHAADSARLSFLGFGLAVLSTRINEVDGGHVWPYKPRINDAVRAAMKMRVKVQQPVKQDCPVREE